MKNLKKSVFNLRLILVLVSLIILASLVYALNFNDLIQSDFNNGIYNNTQYNSIGVILSGNNLTGTYTSRVFDAGSLALWNNMSTSSNIPFVDYLFAVDTVSDIWKSTNQSSSWLKVNDDYNNGNANGATDMTKNSSGALFILDTQDLWKSLDYGVTWTLANDDVNGAGDSNSGLVVEIDSNNYIYIIDGSEDVLKSTNQGASFTKVNSADLTEVMVQLKVWL